MKRSLKIIATIVTAISAEVLLIYLALLFFTPSPEPKEPGNLYTRVCNNDSSSCISVWQYSDDYFEISYPACEAQSNSDSIVMKNLRSALQQLFNYEQEKQLACYVIFGTCRTDSIITEIQELTEESCGKDTLTFTQEEKGFSFRWMGGQ